MILPVIKRSGSSISTGGAPPTLAKAESKYFEIDRHSDAWTIAGTLFDAVDDNGDGMLSWAELHEYLSGPQVNLEPKECKELFKLLDNNNDGNISRFEFATGFEEFRSNIMNLKEGELDDNAYRGKTWMNEAKADQGRNGRLSDTRKDSNGRLSDTRKDGNGGGG
eukprot:CAMPEP_0197591296 /NCGR_PEP_ID=MMETSP1326-20131121/12994_1 /TAXON_ID=1155430 /ORGANISM="Genus nov. species nov., Strain RCC2288" /LENGTH=164 /DNA_ID=CAMNT_0043156695 /DNA_START=57 /DNA_END=547 /DNA_ORIENTATION=-